MSTEEHIPYNEREEWQDITPIPQDDGPDPVCPIAYSDDYRTAMDYFRAVSARCELSERVLALTEDIINMNPGHYTIWLYRKNILLNINADLEKELEFIAKMVSENPKCYQLWHHRQVIIEHMGDASKELAFIESALKEDPKNFHAWSYRQWVIKTFGLWDNELTYINRLLEEDVRNNSAWNQRYFITHYRPEPVTDAELQAEVEYTLKQIRWTPSNESAWNYLIGTIRHSPNLLLGLAETAIYKLLDEDFISVPLLAFLVHAYQDYPEDSPAERYDKAIWACQELAERHDRIRQRYWQFRHSEIVKTN